MTGLKPGTSYVHEGLEFSTLARPPGERLATVTTVNDLHFGETECGSLDIPGIDIGPVLRTAPGHDPYPDVMNRGAVAEMAALAPDAVIAKGDLTDASRPEEMAAFLALYQGAFGDRLWWVRGNHDTLLAPTGPHRVALPGVILAIVDTAVPNLASGRLGAEQLDWLDQVGADADRPVLVFGHHHCWMPGSRARPDGYFGLHPDDSEALVAVVARRRALVGYFAGHTHRNRVRRFPRPARSRGSRWPASRTSREPGRNTGCSRAASCRSATASPRRRPWPGASGAGPWCTATTPPTPSVNWPTAASPSAALRREVFPSCG